MASSQCLELFKDLQKTNSQSMIENVRTWWNSLYDMLSQAYELQIKLSQWIECLTLTTSRMKLLKCNTKEWQHIKYMLYLLKHFKNWTETIDAISESTIYKLWYTYNDLFDHLKKQNEAIREFELFFSTEL